MARKPEFSVKPLEACPLDLLHFPWLQELSDQAGSEFENSDVRWVITVPAIWKQPAKQFMRQAAYQVSAGLGVGRGPRCARRWLSPHSGVPKPSPVSWEAVKCLPQAGPPGAFPCLGFLLGGHSDKGRGWA